MNTFPLTKTYVDPFFHQGIKFSQEDDFKSRCLSRLYWMGGAVLSSLTTPVDNLVGIVSGAFSLMGEIRESLKSQPNWESLNSRHKFTVRCFKECYGLSCPFAGILFALNPDAVIDEDSEEYWISGQGSGLISHHVRLAISAKAEETADSDFWGDRLIAKILYGAIIPVCLVTRIADFAIGLLAAPAAFVTGGLIPSLNHCAYRGLMIDGFIQDLFLATIKMIHLESAVDLKESGEKLKFFPGNPIE